MYTAEVYQKAAGAKRILEARKAKLKKRTADRTFRIIHPRHIPIIDSIAIEGNNN